MNIKRLQERVEEIVLEHSDNIRIYTDYDSNLRCYKDIDIQLLTIIEIK